VGYGRKAHAHSLNLKDSGVKVTVALRKAERPGARPPMRGWKSKRSPMRSETPTS